VVSYLARPQTCGAAAGILERRAEGRTPSVDRLRFLDRRGGGEHHNVG
jgi:hypothetical protein